MRKEIVLFAAFFSLVLILPPASANRGSMGIGPGNVRLEESGQNAIVAWNGNEEVIILSTDMKSSEPVLVLEVIPLPSNPRKVEQGKPGSFTKLADIINRKAEAIRNKISLPGTQRGPVPGVEVTFHERIGAHDLTIVRVNDLDYFTGWVRDFTLRSGLEYSVPSAFKDTVSSYLERGIDHFVFDVIEINESSRTISPIMYRFESDYLYYPLEITSTSDIGWSSSVVNVFIIAKGIVEPDVLADSMLYPRVGFEDNIELSRSELMEISPELEDLFRSNAFVMNARYSGPLSSLGRDLVVRQEDLSQPVVYYFDLVMSSFLVLIALVMAIMIYKIAS